MRRSSWNLLVAVTGVLIVLVIVICFLPGALTSTTLKGPVGIVRGEPPKHGLLGVSFKGEARR
jgi:hypothetical protein